MLGQWHSVWPCFAFFFRIAVWMTRLGESGLTSYTGKQKTIISIYGGMHAAQSY